MPRDSGGIGSYVMAMRLWISEHDGIARRSFPVTGGIALPREFAGETAQILLKDRDGRAVPLQTEALSRWPDRSLRWALLDFQTDIEAFGTRTFRLAVGDAAAPERPLPRRAVAEGEPLFVPSGPSRMSGSHVRVVDADGAEWDSFQAGPTTVEREGALRTTVRTCGTVRSMFRDQYIRWQARTDFFRGHGWTRTRFTYIAGGPKALRLSELALVVRLEEASTVDYCYAGSLAPWKAETTPLVCASPGGILQVDASSSRVVATDGTELRAETLKNRGYAGAASKGT